MAKIKKLIHKICYYLKYGVRWKLKYPKNYSSWSKVIIGYICIAFKETFRNEEDGEWDI